MLSGPVLGFVLSRLDQCTSAVNFVTAHTLKIDLQEVKANEMMDVTLRQFWDLECLGIKSDEERILGKIDESIVFKDGCYQVSLSWKEPHPTLPNNYQLSKK